MATFSVADTARKVRSVASGSTDFSFSFQVNNTTDVDVYLNNVLQTSGFSIVDSSFVKRFSGTHTITPECESLPIFCNSDSSVVMSRFSVPDVSAPKSL